MKLDRIGTRKKEISTYDGKLHNLCVTDYLIRLTGNTYPRKNDIYNEGFRWDSDENGWFKNVDSESEASRLYKKFTNSGIVFGIKAIYRITDKL